MKELCTCQISQVSATTIVGTLQESASFYIAGTNPSIRAHLNFLVFKIYNNRLLARSLQGLTLHCGACAYRFTTFVHFRIGTPADLPGI